MFLTGKTADDPEPEEIATEVAVTDPVNAVFLYPVAVAVDADGIATVQLGLTAEQFDPDKVRFSVGCRIYVVGGECLSGNCGNKYVDEANAHLEIDSSVSESAHTGHLPDYAARVIIRDMYKGISGLDHAVSG